MVEKLTYEEKVESILSILATPIYRRRINDEGINKLITEAYLEMKDRKAINKTQELINNMMMDYYTNPEEYFSDYDIDEMFPEHEYGCIDIIN